MISTKTFDVGAKWVGTHMASALFNDAAGRASSAVDALLAPTKVAAMGAIWANNPIILPDVSLLFSLGTRGMIGVDLMRLACASQGVNLGYHLDSPHQRNASTMWSAALELSKEVPSVAYIMDCYARGYFEGRGNDFKAAMTRAGGNADVWVNYVDPLYEYPPVGDLVEARNREFITHEQWVEGLKRNGFGLSLHRTMYDKMRERLPGPSDLVHFAVKEAFTPELAGAVGLYDEFPDAIRPYMEGQGLGWEVGFNIRADGVERPATVPDLYWAAHWQPISPSQAYEMFHRLRPNRLGRYAAAGINATAFTLQDVERWLRINDYPDSVRSNLLTLSFTPMRLIDIRAAMALKYRVDNDPIYARSLPFAVRERSVNYGRQWGIEQFRDRGVVPEDAAVQADLAIVAAANRLTAPIQAIERGVIRKSFATIISLYRMGINDREDSEILLGRLGFTADTIGVYLDAAERDFQLQRMGKVLTALRRSFLSGALGADNAIDALTRSGIVASRARDYVTMWATEATYNRRQATTEKILGWVAKGGMPVEEARNRLINLGWTDPDMRLLLVEAQSKLITLQGRAMKAADSDRRKRAAELLKVQRDLQRQANLVQGALRRQTPVATLKRWLQKGLVNSAQFLARMQQQGYELPVAQRYASDAMDTLTVTTLQRWLRKREISETTFLRHLAAKGIDPDTAHNWLVDALTPEPQKLYPKPPADKTTAGTATLPSTPPPTQPVAAQPLTPLDGASNENPGTTLHTTPEVLHTQPEQLHTLPGQLGTGNQGGP